MKEEGTSLLMQSALLGSRLDAAIATAPPLEEAASAALDAQYATSDLPSFASLTAALRVPASRADSPAAHARLPMRVLANKASDFERGLWKAYEARGLHELLSTELLGALAAHVQATLAGAPIRISGLVGRADLNGRRAVILGPSDQSGRVPVRICATGECVRARRLNVFGQDALPTVLEVGAGGGHLSRHLAKRLHGWAVCRATDSKAPRSPGATGAPSPDEFRQFDVERLDCEAAVERYRPTVVIMSWLPSGIDWGYAIRS